MNRRYLKKSKKKQPLHELKIIDDQIFLDGQKLRGVTEYVVRAKAEELTSVKVEMLVEARF
ncbi:hypothetical protein ACYRFT_01350 [Listeria kieliensis]